jgi:predicted NAD/FAD-binding protein
VAYNIAKNFSDQFEITILEKNNYVGGHTNTIQVEEDNRTVPVDTGFIVFNNNTYPNLIRFFEDLGVDSGRTKMSFSFYNQNTNLQWAGAHLNRVFGQRKNLFNPSFYKFLMQARRFGKTAHLDLESEISEQPLREYMQARGYGEDLLHNMIVPMGSAVWSTPVEKMYNFPARSFIQFFHNHGFIGIGTQFQWRYVKGGSNSYIKKLLEKYNFIIHKSESVQSIKETKSQVLVKTKKQNHKFDYVFVATHADHALKLLDNPTVLQQRLLEKFKYQKNIAILHTDEKMMPPIKRVWAAWNYKTLQQGKALKTSTVYYMNILQNLNSKKDYFVSINDYEDISLSKVIREINYEHPLFDEKAVNAQKELPKLNQNGRVRFAGSYFNYGFHEDAYTSSIGSVESFKTYMQRNSK